MKRKATNRLEIIRREALYVHDEFDHSLMLGKWRGNQLNIRWELQANSFRAAA